MCQPYDLPLRLPVGALPRRLWRRSAMRVHMLLYVLCEMLLRHGPSLLTWHKSWTLACP